MAEFKRNSDSREYSLSVCVCVCVESESERLIYYNKFLFPK